MHFSFLYPAARKLLFCLSAEKAHELSLSSLAVLEKIKVCKLLETQRPSKPVECMGLTFPNAIGLAAGLDKDAKSFCALGRMGFGHIEVGTLTAKPQPGNPQPRLFRLKDKEAIINRMGFNNQGIVAANKRIKPHNAFQRNGGILGINIGKNKITPNEEALNDYLYCLQQAWDKADFITINLSSPNTPGLRDLQSEEQSAKLLNALKKEQERLSQKTNKYVPIALKVAPDLDEKSIAAMSNVFLNEGLDGLVATNTTLDRTSIINHPLAEQTGGLSGVPLAKRSTEVIAAFASHLGGKIPIIGVGGIHSIDDAEKKLKAGATLLQVYTAFIYQGPALIENIARHLAKQA